RCLDPDGASWRALCWSSGDPGSGAGCAAAADARASASPAVSRRAVVARPDWWTFPHRWASLHRIMRHALRTGSRSTTTLLVVALLSMVGVACSAPLGSGDGTPATSPSTAPIPDAATLTAYDPATPLDLTEESPVQT